MVRGVLLACSVRCLYVGHLVRVGRLGCVVHAQLFSQLYGQQGSEVGSSVLVLACAWGWGGLFSGRELLQQRG